MSFQKYEPPIIGNKILHKKWMAKERRIHKRKVIKAAQTATVDMSPPESMRFKNPRARQAKKIAIEERKPT